MRSPSSCVASTWPRLFEQGAALPRRRRRPDVDLELDGHELAATRTRHPPVDLRLRSDVSVAVPSTRARQCANGSTSSNESGPAAEDARFAVGTARVVHLARAEDVEHAAVGEREVHLHVVRLPLVGDGLDADARHAELGSCRPTPTRSPTRASRGRRAASRTRIRGRRSGRPSGRSSSAILTLHGRSRPPPASRTPRTAVAPGRGRGRTSRDRSRAPGS